jgi:MFS family permease
MTDAVVAPSGSRAGANPWVVAAIVVVPTFMEVLDTTIAIVALRYIVGGLSATVDDGEWVITSYLAANAIILPITGWLSAHLGRRNYFLISIAYSPLPRRCVEWPQVSASSSCFGCCRAWLGAGFSRAAKGCCWTPSRARSKA